MNKPGNHKCGPNSCSPAADLTAKEPADKPMELLVFSDFVCPWCLVGKARLEAAFALRGVALSDFTLPLAGGSDAVAAGEGSHSALTDRLSQRVQRESAISKCTFAPAQWVSVKWMPFELNPNMPVEGIDRKTYRSAKFGSWAQSRVLDAQVERAAKDDGLVFRHDLIERTPNTRAAHRLTWLADQQGKQNDVAMAILKAYFLEGRDIGQVEVLADIAAERGMDRSETLEKLSSDAGNAEVEALIAKGRRLGISSVPTVVRDGEPLFAGAQDPRAIAVAIFGKQFGEVS